MTAFKNRLIALFVAFVFLPYAAAASFVLGSYEFYKDELPAFFDFFKDAYRIVFKAFRDGGRVDL
ncbi:MULTISPECIES: hypothetical protein [unclassified Sphingomonas]|uniref:hypothetical protein n=1 Tax=unclassified Sphingomonas TaxID=196159 RepID=UPI002150C632|nr:MULTISPECIES: hypothetical protein [unclassified Sphingomonas]MCR5870689.1 hypothetical protein [Sphingomonas sp. J344]UUY00975.1 hypothetical protein LRS08_07945 [Sphingomonas sp. J315]